MNGLFDYLGGCTGKKIFLKVSGGGQEGWNVFFKCVLMNCPTIQVGAWEKFFL